MSLNNWLDIFGQIFKKAGLTQTFLRKKWQTQWPQNTARKAMKEWKPLVSTVII